MQSKQLSFPSASAIEFYGDKLYVFGDDAAYLLVLSPDYTPIDSVFFKEKTFGRIPKAEKHDIESALIRMEEMRPVLYGFGSMSNETRRSVVTYNLQSGAFTDVAFPDTAALLPLLPALNIEGSCMVGNTTVFANRANISAPVNYLIFRDAGSAGIAKPIALPREKMVAGISALYYVKEKDLLLFTASEEETGSTTADGAIGDSYLGWIENFSTKMQLAEFTPDQFTRLSEIDTAFSKQKVESVCVEKSEGNTLLLHLVADNDDGTSGFFKLKVSL